MDERTGSRATRAEDAQQAVSGRTVKVISRNVFAEMDRDWKRRFDGPLVVEPDCNEAMAVREAAGAQA